MPCSDEIRSEDLLYRVIKRAIPRWAQPFLGDDGCYHLTSAVFKDKNGNSVDSYGGQVEEKVVSFIRDNFGERTKGIARTSAEDCFKANATVKPAPTDKNPYHANIFLSGSIPCLFSKCRTSQKNYYCLPLFLSSYLKRLAKKLINQDSLC